MDAFPWPAISNGVGVVVVVLVVGWLVWTGRLVPKPTHDSQVALLNQRIADERHEKGEWRTEARLKDQTVAGSYFDGDTADTADYVYAWTGTPHASTSVRTPRGVLA